MVFVQVFMQSFDLLLVLSILDEDGNVTSQNVGSHVSASNFHDTASGI